MPDDRFADYYANKLWQLIPAVYRSLDSDPSAPGPLREMVNRIGAQAAVVRRSIDRMWEDQSIETCDDWVIPYIGDLLATRLVACLDARGQRLDVAKTIYYRRRKGTVGLLEELASDIADADARVVESFRRLARTRHGFDPPIGLVALKPDPSAPPAPAVVEGLIGAYSRTPMGGYADLRHAYGASKTNTAFDEFFHTADFRLGRPSVGWHNIPRLGVFQWWTESFAVPPTTPVQDAQCPGQFTFDPTGREIPLFAASQRGSEHFGEHWVSPDEWQLPVPISTPLWRLQPGPLYPSSLSVIQNGAATAMPPTAIDVSPERGRFRWVASAPAGTTAAVTYHFGFASPIGAVPFDRRTFDGIVAAATAPAVGVQGGGTQLTQAVGALGAQGSVLVNDSLTYAPPVDLGGATGLQSVALVGKDTERPVVRWTTSPRPTWVITGAAGAELLLQGLYLVGADVVLRGQFAKVSVQCATLDPGTSGLGDTPSTIFRAAVDAVPLAPMRLFVEASVQALTFDRCVTGPVRTRTGGAIETLTIRDSIVQAIRETPQGAFTVDDLYDAGGLAVKLGAGADPLSHFLQSQLSPAGRSLVAAYTLGQPPTAALLQQLVTELNALLSGPSLFDATRFAQVHLSPATEALTSQALSGANLATFNRQLLEEGYRVELSVAAIATTAGTVSLARTTVLGPMAVHRLDASECVLDDLVFAEDEQYGCVRFSAYADGSVVHQPYESVTIAPAAPLFRTRLFGSPDYARLREGVDSAIVWGRSGASIEQGAQNGSEMGAFSLQKVPLKKRGLQQKFAEFMPVGLVPVWVDVT